MMQLLPKTTFDFVGKRNISFAISAFFVLLSAGSLLVKGLNLGLDFTGGTLLQVKFESPTDIGTLRNALREQGVDAEIQSYTGRNAYAIKVKGAQNNVNEAADKILGAINKALPGDKFSEERREFVGPVVGRDLSKKALFALILSMFGIIIYVAFRFSNPIWGAMGVVALLHDVFIAVGFFSLTGRQVDLVIIAAFLTIAGFSINDTIVIFDRMRENIRLSPRTPLAELINRSINETLSRTVITSLTVFFAVAILYFAGGEVINGFAFAMLIGCVCGVYSTIAIASPLVYVWETAGKDKNQGVEQKKKK